MKRLSIVIALGVVLLLGTGVLAQTSSISKDAENFVKGVLRERGIGQDQIKNVEKVDMKKLPKEVNLQNIDDTNLAMYKIDMGLKKPVYIITASEENFKKEIKKFANKALLNFGFGGELDSSSFLNSAAGVQSSYDKGYVMIRDGSITGVSTSLEVVKSLQGGVAEIIIYKNGEVVGFRNTFDLENKGPKTDYDTIDEGTINFEKGDILSVKVIISEGGSIKDVNTLLEIVTKA